jgi:hypothetical protein
MNGFESVDAGVTKRNWAGLGRAAGWPRSLREAFVILGVSGTVLLFSGPVRGELADHLAGRALGGVEAWIPARLAAAWMPPAAGQVVISLLAIVGFAALVLLLAAGLQAVSQLQRYAFNGVIERRFAVVPTRFQVISTALPLTLGLALACKGPAGLCACAMFTVLLTAIRLTVGRDYDVFVSSPDHEPNPPRQKEPDAGGDSGVI